jgi:anionic cell wall polymer biosynthesis LytR-Cps2A-Psr (LCP) family protein
MILAYVQPHLKHISLISIPRDLWVQIPTGTDTTQHFKINSAYVIGLDDRNYPNKPIEYTGGAAGGGTLAKHTVEEVLGIPVRYFVSLDFEGFKKSIDILGGVDVTVTRAFEDPYYPITGKETDACDKTEDDIKKLMATLSGDLLEHEFPCRYENLKFDKGQIHMDGETALKFARSRHALEDGSDFARSNRQKQIMLAVKDKVLQIGFLSKALPFLQSLSGDVRTDIPLDVMRAAITQVGDYKTYTVNSIALSTDNALMQTYSADRQYILVGKSGVDNWQSVHEFISTEIAKLSPSPTPTASPK